MKKILALDFGTKRIGLAVNQELLAVPVKIITYQKQSEALEEIVAFCQKNNIELIVLGLSEQKSAEKTQQFGHKLKSLISIPLVYSDETLSSVEVIERLKLRHKPLPKEIDHYAAAFILEEWLILNSLQTLE